MGSYHILVDVLVDHKSEPTFTAEEIEDALQHGSGAHRGQIAVVDVRVKKERFDHDRFAPNDAQYYTDLDAS